jgi:hypothetical protein
MKKKYILAFSILTTLVFGLGLLSFSFADSKDKKDEEKPKVKHIKLVRSYQGETKTYDTLVPITSSYDAEDYLEELGFDDDANLSIIRLSGDSINCDFDEVFNHINFFSSDDFLEDFQIDLEKFELELEEGLSEIQKGLDEVMAVQFIDNEMIDLSKLFDDSSNFFNAFTDTSFQTEDGAQVRVMCHVIGSESDSIEWTNEVHHEVVKEYKEDDFNIDFTDVDIKVSMDEYEEDFTMVIVTVEEAGGGPGQSVISEENDFQLYPNPANDWIKLSAKFDKKAQTTVLISNLNGEVVKEVKMGTKKQIHTDPVDISKLKPGIYSVHILHGEERLIKQLVIQ